MQTYPPDTESRSSWEDAPSTADAHPKAWLSHVETVTVLLQRRWRIAQTTGIFILIGIILCLVLPVRYTSKAELMPPQKVDSLSEMLTAELGIGSLASAAGGSFLRDPNAVYIGILQSRPIEDAIIKKFDLMHAFHNKNMSDCRRELESRTEIESEKSTLLTISVKDRDPQRAADLVNAYIAEFRSLTTSVALQETARRRLFYEEQLSRQKDALAMAEMNLTQVQKNKGMVHPLQAEVLMGSLATLRAQIAAQQVQVQGLRSFSTEHNADLQIAEKELAAMQAEAARMAEHGNSSGFSDIGLKDVPDVGLSFVRATREVEYQQAVYTLLLKQYEAARLDESNEAYVVQVVERPIPMDHISSPRYALILAICTILGFLLGVLRVIFAKRYEDALLDPMAAEKLAMLRNQLPSLLKWRKTATR
jgi:uncharacterized protein involved in exopolysaccharide biosynthesis